MKMFDAILKKIRMLYHDVMNLFTLISFLLVRELLKDFMKVLNIPLVIFRILF